MARFLTNPVALGARRCSCCWCCSAPARRSAPSAAAACRPRPAAARDLWRLHDRVVARRSARARPCPRRRTCCRSRCWPRSLGGSVAAAVSAILLLAVPVALWGAWRFLRVVGRLSDAAGAPRWLLAVAASTYALVPVVSGAWGDGRLGIVVVDGRAAVAGPRRARLRRPRARPALAGGLALGTAARPGRGVHARRLVLRRRTGRRASSASASAIAPGADARPLGLGPAGRDARGRARAARAVVAAGRRARRRAQPAARHRPAARARSSASTSCSPAGCPATSARPGGWASPWS